MVVLTERDLSILALIGSGHSAAEIAERLALSPRTVVNLKRRLYAKLDVSCQSQAVLRAIALGVFDGPGVADPPGDAPSPIRLTGREEQVLQSIARGHTIRQTARALGIAAKTVENTQARLFRKLGARNRAEALTVAYRLGRLPGRLIG